MTTDEKSLSSAIFYESINRMKEKRLNKRRFFCELLKALSSFSNETFGVFVSSNFYARALKTWIKIREKLKKSKIKKEIHTNISHRTNNYKRSFFVILIALYMHLFPTLQKTGRGPKMVGCESSKCLCWIWSCDRIC